LKLQWLHLHLLALELSFEGSSQMLLAPHIDWVHLWAILSL